MCTAILKETQEKENDWNRGEKVLKSEGKKKKRKKK